jgi:hypothetical protein
MGKETMNSIWFEKYIPNTHSDIWKSLSPLLALSSFTMTYTIDILLVRIRTSEELNVFEFPIPNKEEVIINCAYQCDEWHHFLHNSMHLITLSLALYGMVEVKET